MSATGSLVSRPQAHVELRRLRNADYRLRIERRPCYSTTIRRPRLSPAPVPAYIGRMNDIVNLKRARKAKARAEAEAKAQANRVTHGRTKTEKTLTKAQQEAAARKLDGHKRNDD